MYPIENTVAIEKINEMNLNDTPNIIFMPSVLEEYVRVLLYFFFLCITQFLINLLKF